MKPKDFEPGSEERRIKKLFVDGSRIHQNGLQGFRKFGDGTTQPFNPTRAASETVTGIYMMHEAAQQAEEENLTDSDDLHTIAENALEVYITDEKRVERDLQLLKRREANTVFIEKALEKKRAKKTKQKVSE